MEALRDIPIEQLIPHRPPMILVDKLLAYSSKGACCELAILPNHVFLQPEGVPAHIGMEFMAQTLAAMNGYQSRIEGRPPDVGFLLGTPKFESSVPFFKQGQRLKVEVTLVWGDDELRQFQCKIEDFDSLEVLQTATINAFVPNDLDGYLKQEREA